MERLVNHRLNTIIDQKLLLDDRQYAFRPGRSTDDYLCLLECILDDALSRSQHIELLSLDLSKAFDCVEHNTILTSLRDWGISGKLYQYIQSFLTNRTIQVLVNNSLSSPRQMPTGVPQGSVISPTLFLIAINSIFKIIPENIKILVYADDILLISISAFARLTRIRLQTALDKIAIWAPKIGFRFSPDKSKLLHLGPNRKKLKKLPPLKLFNQSIPFVHSFRLLGVWIDDRLTFSTHLNQIRKNSKNKLNLLRILSKTPSHANRDSLIKFVHGWLLPSALHDLGLISRSGPRLYHKLEPLYNGCIRTVGSAFVTSPIVSIMAECGQLPFNYLVAKHLTSKSVRWLAIGGNSDAPLVTRTNTILQNLINCSLPSVCPRRKPPFRYWTEKTPPIDFSLSLKIKAGQPSCTVLPFFHELVDRKYRTTTHIFTDGSKTIDGQVGCGIEDPLNKRSLALPSQCSVFSAEAYALLNALQNIPNQPTSTTIFSDSASVLKAVAKGSIKHPWISSISHEALKRGATLVWIPGHAGIPGNESADRLASIGANLTPPSVPIPQQDAYRDILLHLSL
ncbi:uncharacterized protein LOC129744736 [Uranotaenia lowii]|uniref:uncharacterized protein LOC129744736 n=1 Tax=Uranotaenia lowii TaxID=190385 RepID=UPI00247981AD|nr:uncharacterized protein LOC129744736 [Uranotaenia lowii]XP_055593396.1 uncharacterized protein LOC129744736 [Uranotaenia lowii]